MKTDDFLKNRKSDWQRLAELVAICQRNVNELTPNQIEMLSNLYRSATSDLALAQRDFPDSKITAYLNNLVAQAHMVIYRQEAFSWRKILEFFTTVLPKAYRHALPFTISAALFLILPGLLAGFIISTHPDTSSVLLPPEVQALSGIIAEKTLWTDIPVEERPYASSFIMTNNIQVSLLAFGSGILGGVVTIWILIFNGLILGGLTGLTLYHGIAFELWSFVIAHGVIELSVIFISGGCGLMLGWSLLRPGLLSRKDSLIVAARDAIKLVIGLMPFLVLAGLIEGFISPNENIIWQAKWAIGIFSGFLMHGYLLFSGKSPQAELSS